MISGLSPLLNSATKPIGNIAVLYTIFLLSHQVFFLILDVDRASSSCCLFKTDHQVAEVVCQELYFYIFRVVNKFLDENSAVAKGFQSFV